MSWPNCCCCRRSPNPGTGMRLRSPANPKSWIVWFYLSYPFAKRNSFELADPGSCAFWPVLLSLYCFHPQQPWRAEQYCYLNFITGETSACKGNVCMSLRAAKQGIAETFPSTWLHMVSSWINAALLLNAYVLILEFMHRVGVILKCEVERCAVWPQLIRAVWPSSRLVQKGSDCRN